MEVANWAWFLSSPGVALATTVAAWVAVQLAVAAGAWVVVASVVATWVAVVVAVAAGAWVVFDSEVAAWVACGAYFKMMSLKW